MSISLGLVGCGAFGRSFIKLFKDHPDVHRMALCDLSPDLLGRAAKEHEIAETYDSLEAICRTDLDALVLITQHWMHAPQAVQAMESGKHVYTAVPAAWSLEECDQLVAAVKRTGQIYMNGETSYFRRENVYCRNRARAGDFGHITYVEAEYLHDLDHGLREVAQRRAGASWSMKKSGGAPMKYPSHSLAFPVSITGSHITSVSCLGFAMPNDDWWRADTESGCLYSCETAFFGLASGASGQIREYRRVGFPGAERLTRVYGTEASFEGSLRGMAWATKQGWEPIDPPIDHEPLPEALAADRGGHGGSHAYLVHEFVDSVNHLRLPRVNVWEAVRYCAPGHVAHESAMKDGERLPVPDWGDAPA